MCNVDFINTFAAHDVHMAAKACRTHSSTRDAHVVYIVVKARGNRRAL